MPPLARRRVAEVRGELRVGLLADRAGVEDEDVGVLGLRRLAEPERLEHALDALRVVSVHLAAERRDVVAPHAGEGSPGRPGYRLAPSERPIERFGMRVSCGDVAYRPRR